MVSTLLVATLMAIAADPVMQYTVSFSDAPRHTLDIEMIVPTDGEREIELMLPTWTPGSYLIREYARNIEKISAHRVSDGTLLTISKSAKNRWKIDTQSQPNVLVRYRLYCRELSVRTNWVEADWAFLTGAGTFLTCPKLTNQPHRIRLLLPAHWPDVATSLKTESADGLTIAEAPNYDVLVDSPILAGTLKIDSFDVGDKPHRLATLAADRLWDTRKAAEDSAKIIETQQKFWGTIPYENYVFLNIAAEAGGGLEHDNSCVLMTSRWQQKKRENYLNWLSLVSHEFFHTWNVRRLRPKELQVYNYEREQLFDELWIAEGITSYYDDLFVARCGLMTQDEYLERLSKTISGLQGTPGRELQSLADSSKDAWIKLYRPDENSHNSRISYYVKGAVLAALLDVQIQQATQGQACLDDVMRKLWQDHQQTGYTSADFNRIVSEVAGNEVVTWLDKMVYSTEQLDYSPLLNWYGLQFKAPKELGPNTKPEIYFGADATLTDGKLIVKRVMRDSPAYAAGINVDDELLALDDYRIGGDWMERLEHYQVDDVVETLISRRGKISKLPVRLAAKPTSQWKLESAKEPTEDQSTRIRKWLNIAPTEKAPADKNTGPQTAP